MCCKFSEERETKLAEFRARIALLAEELEGLAESKLLKEESFLVRFFFSNRTLRDNRVLIIHYQKHLRFLRGSNWDVDIAAGLIAGSHRMIQVYILSH